MGNQRPNDLSAAALDMAARGFRVHPVHGITDRVCTCAAGGACERPGKHPHLSDWPDRATRDPEAIGTWWANWPDANVGIATGAASGVIVIDVDPDKGGDETLAALEAELGPVPDTVEVMTGGGGRHRWFRHPGGRVPNSAGTLGPGLDVRGDGGYVLAPPSAHASTRTYEWEASSTIGDMPVAELPVGWASRLQNAPPGRSINHPGWVAAALGGVAQGQRNDVAAKLAGYYMRQGLTTGDVAVLLKSSFGPSCTPPLDAREVDAVVASVSRTRDRQDGRPGAIGPATRPSAGAAPSPTAPSDAVDAAVEREAPARPPEPARRPPSEYPRTDAGNAELIAALFGDRLRYDHRRGRWLVWAEHRWVEDPDGAPPRLALRAARLRYRDAEDLGDQARRKQVAKWAIGSESRMRIDAALALAGTLRPITDDGGGWDADSWLMACANGVVDLRSGRLRDGQPDDRITMATGVPYDPDATAPRFEQFLEEVFEGHADLVTFLQRAAGYSIAGDVSEQVVFICHGTGANGKSTLMGALRAALGDYAHNAPFSAFELRHQAAIPAELADLAGRRFVTASETGETSRMNEARIKALSGGDPLTARHLYGRWFTFEPTAKLWLSVNHRPVVTDDSHGFWRRVRLVPFTRRFTEDEQDHRLADALRAEAEGILAWLVRGCLDWQDLGLQPPSSVLAATEAYREDSDSLGAFLAAACDLEDAYAATSRALFRAYTEYADAEGIPARERLSHTPFGRRLGDRFPGAKTREGKVYHGLRVRL